MGVVNGFGCSCSDFVTEQDVGRDVQVTVVQGPGSGTITGELTDVGERTITVDPSGEGTDPETICCSYIVALSFVTTGPPA